MLNNYPRLKKFLHYLLIHPYSARPRVWARIFVTPFIIKRGCGSIIRHSARLDIIPSKRLVVGKRAIIEDYALINNCMGDVIIGDHSMILSRSKVVGPVVIGQNVIVSSGSHITGLTHDYEDITRPIRLQGVTTNLTTIEDDVWIGGNAAINQGIT
ncbi:MAG: DapH/DapD/GlmU-related protein, partial [Rikenellaceae bacterium]